MDYSSDNDSNQELQRDQEIIESEQFNIAIAFNNNREINGEDDDIGEEDLYFKKREPTFSQTQEEPTYIIPGEQNVNVFNPWAKKYNYIELYSKPCKFKTYSGPRKRGDMPDNMRKKINTDFYQNLTKFINSKLKDPEAQQKNLKFSNFPQCIVANVTKELNKKIMNMALKELILDDSFKNFNQLKERDITNYENNKAVINYLENKYCKDVNYNIIMKMKMKDIYNEYLKSDEFQKSIQELIQDGRYYDYIRNYIEVAKNFVDYYS
jgi:hypothetical protein